GSSLVAECPLLPRRDTRPRSAAPSADDGRAVAIDRRCARKPDRHCGEVAVTRLARFGIRKTWHNSLMGRTTTTEYPFLRKKTQSPCAYLDSSRAWQVVYGRAAAAIAGICAATPGPQASPGTRKWLRWYGSDAGQEAWVDQPCNRYWDRHRAATANKLCRNRPTMRRPGGCFAPSLQGHSHPPHAPPAIARSAIGCAR